jgi:lipoyl(octanoyl) transferase
MIKNKLVIFQDWGLLDYKTAWEKQEMIFSETVNAKVANRTNNSHNPIPNHLILVEHPHVYTLGKSGDVGHLLLDENGMIAKHASFYKINRGGDITYHGPGQIVGYPILDLDNFFTDIHLYLRTLEQAVIDTLAEYNIQSGRLSGYTGVWLDAENEKARKICALGVRCSRWVTMHGFALNVNTDLDYFNNIVPCGINDKAVTSMKKELKKEVDMQQVKEVLVNNIIRLFEMHL